MASDEESESAAKKLKTDTVTLTASDERRDGVEKRFAENGKAYTFKEFEECFYHRAKERWEAAIPAGNMCSTSTELDLSDDSHEESAETQRNVVVIGIAGPSNAGKSTVAEELMGELATPVWPIQLDWFFMPDIVPDHPVWGKNGNWETPVSIDFQRLNSELRRITDVLAKARTVPRRLKVQVSNHYKYGFDGVDIVRDDWARRPFDETQVFVIVEGFLLFYDATISALCDVQFWLQADRDICLQRRFERDPGMEFGEFSDWFIELVWKHYEMYKGEQLVNAAKALHVDAAASVGGITELMVAHCHKFATKLKPLVE